MSSSYQQRNLGTEDYQANAKERDAARKSYIKDFTGVANNQISNMKAAANLQKYVDDAELSDFRETQKALREFTQKVGIPIVKMQWQEEINQGIEEYTTRDIDRTQRWNKKRAEIEEAAAKSEGNYQELWEKAKTQLLEEDRNRLLNMSHFEQMGWARARVKEKIGTYRLDRDSYLATSDDILYTDEGIAFKAKEYKEVPGGYEIASASFMNQWYGENARGAGFTKNYSQTQILPAILEEENTAKSEYYKNLRVEKNEDRIDGNHRALYNAFEDGEDDKDSIIRALNTSHIALPSLHNSNNARGGGYVNWRKDVTDQIKALAASQPYYRPEQLKAALKEWTVPGKNGQTLYDAYPDEFSDKIIDGYFDKAARTQGSAALSAQENKKRIFQQDMADLKQKLVDERGMPDDAVMKEFSKTAAYLNMTGNEIAIMRGDLLKENMTDQQMMLHLESQLGLDGEMSRAELDAIKGVSTQVKEQFALRKGVIVDNPFLEGAGVHAALLKGNNDLFNAVEGKAKFHGLPSGTKFKLDKRSEIALEKFKKNGIQLGEKYKEEGLHVKGLVEGAKEKWRANQKLLETNPGEAIQNYTKEDALEEQALELTRAFELLQNKTEFSNHPLYVGTGQGFKNINLAQETTTFKNNEQIREQVIMMQEVVERDGAKALRNLPVSIISETDWRIDAKVNNIPANVFQYMAAADCTSGMDPWDYYNIFAEKAGRPLKEKPTEVARLQTQISNKYMMTMFRNKGSVVCRDQGLNSGGIVTPQRLQNTVQSSSPTFFGSGQFSSAGLTLEELADKQKRSEIYNSLKKGTKK